MSRFLLIRHGDCAPVGRYIAGRAAGILLNGAGEAQVQHLADSLRVTKFDRIISSPLERSVITAQAIGRVQGVAVEADAAFNEIDYGEWTGMTFALLETSERWRAFNAFKSGVRVPGGEMMIEVQERFVRRLVQLHGESPDGVFAVVSHSDPIKAALCAFAGIALDLMGRITVDTASVSALEMSEWGVEIQCINNRGGL